MAVMGWAEKAMVMGTVAAVMGALARPVVMGMVARLVAVNLMS